jgi:hypothetical protein
MYNIVSPINYCLRLFILIFIIIVSILRTEYNNEWNRDAIDFESISV